MTRRAFVRVFAIPLRLSVPCSAPHARGYAAIHASREQQRQQAQCQQSGPATAPQQPAVPTHHERSVTPLEHKFLQVHFLTREYVGYVGISMRVGVATCKRYAPAPCD